MPPRDAVLPDQTADSPDRARRPAAGDGAQDAVQDALRDTVRRTASRAGGERMIHDRAWSSAPEAPLMDSAAGASPELVERLGELRATVWTYARRRRDAGTPVQRVLPEVKALVREALVREALAREGASGAWAYEAAQLLTEPVVRWAIAAYDAVQHAELRAEPSCDTRRRPIR